ncbi:hypothetical protein K1X12_14565 [Hyphomonas sp. WL0036]|uniref:hypothetical protein n=1 Tax=Hyphomonas sediminis TaxID=2866160 RepID=UPI001C8271D2|nr:hypothetical protein [Hyphomonas sediminis]MBY9068131.1 hypothetical protein [Hyphomonas sediminis]
MKALAGPSVAGLLFAFCHGAGSAQTLNDYNPEMRCSGDGLEAFIASGGCDPSSALGQTIGDEAKSSANLWTLLFNEDQKLALLRLGKIDPIFALPQSSPLAQATQRAQQRAEGALFYDPVGGVILVDPDEIFSAAGDGSIEAMLSRAIGQALLAKYPPVRSAMLQDNTSPVYLSALEGLANITAVAAAETAPGVSLSRDFSEPLFGVLNQNNSWGTGRFWADALRLTTQITTADIKDASREVFASIAAASDEANLSAEDLIEYATLAFQQLGWTRFDGDGFAYVYAEVMAAHRFDDSSFITPVEEIFFTPGHNDLIVEDTLPPGFSTAFYTLSIPPGSSRESRIQIDLCRIDENTGECFDDSSLHLIVDGDIASRADSRNYIDTRHGPIERPERNTVRINLLSLSGSGEQVGYEHKIAVGVSATQTDGKPIAYMLSVSGAVLDPPCTWSSMASTLNPWWRGDLNASNALVPNDAELPANIRSELSGNLQGQWYLTEESYRTDIDWDAPIFSGTTGQKRLAALSSFLSEEQIADAHLYGQGIRKGESDALFSFLMPSQAKATLSGAVSDAGTVCVSPVSVSEMPDIISLAGMPDGDPGAILAQMGLPPELATAGSDMEVLAILMGTKGALKELEPSKDVVLQIFTPNLWTQQLGFLPPGAAKPLIHSGTYGWRNNAGVNLYVRLPGTSPQDLRPGRFRATATMQFASDPNSSSFAPEQALPFYSRGWGDAHTTEYEDYIENGLTGWLTIERQTFGAAIAKLELSGPAWRYASPEPALNPQSATPAGQVQMNIERFLMLGYLDDQQLPGMTPLSLKSAIVPAPHGRQ